MQQNTIAFSKGNPLQAMSGVARAMALPHEHPPQRFPSFPALERTAVMGFNFPGPWGVTTNKAILMRQAAYPLWVEYDTPAFNYTVDYTSRTLEQSFTPVSLDRFSLEATIANWNVGARASSLYPSVTYAGTSNVAMYPPLGRDDTLGPTPWTYIPVGATVGLIISGDAEAPDVAGVVFDRWGARGERSQYELVAVKTAGGHTTMFFSYVSLENVWVRPTAMQFGAFVAPANRKMRISIVVTSGTIVFPGSAAAFGGTATCNGAPVALPIRPLLPFTAPAEFANSSLPWSNTRLTAVATLYTNVTKVLSKEGTVLAGRLSPEQVDVWNFTQAHLTNLHPAEKAYLPLESGHYTYCPPSTDLAAFWDYTLDRTTTSPSQPAPAPVVRLDNTALVNCALFADQDSGDATRLAVNLDFHIEFRTTSALWQIGLSAMTLESLHQAQLSLVAAGFFFPNKSHAAILNRIATWAKAISPSVGLVSPMAGRVLRKTSKAVIKMTNAPRTNVPATSAEGSGIVSKKKGPKGEKPGGKTGKKPHAGKS